MRIARSDRILIVGTTGSGKSVLARQLFASFRPPRLVIDPKDDTAATGGRFPDRREAVTFRDARRLPRGAEVARFVPRDPFDLEETGAVYESVWLEGRGRFVWLDEAGIVAPESGAPRQLRRHVTQGRAKGLGHMTLNQRPVRLDRSITGNAEHVVVFRLHVPDDVRTAADVAGLDRRQLDGLLRKAPRYGFAWYAAGDNTLAVCGPVAKR